MGSGIQEILLLVLVIVIVLFLPKLRSTGSDSQAKGSPMSLAGRLRLAIMASLCWAALMAVFLEPWQGSWLRFLYFGIGPVLASWGIYWVVRGYRKVGK
jgi:hypothetical protein